MPRSEPILRVQKRINPHRMSAIYPKIQVQRALLPMCACLCAGTVIAMAGRSACMAALYSAAPGAWPALELLALLPLLPETSRRRVRCQVLPPGSSAPHIIFLSSTFFT